MSLSFGAFVRLGVVIVVFLGIFAHILSFYLMCVRKNVKYYFL